MNFTAIDFETANNKRTSGCSLGLVKFENGVITQTRNFLFKPKPFFFTNSHIHHIYENDVIDKPYFIDLWDEINNLIDGDLLVAHNAAFDLSVLRSMLELENVEFPDLKYACTWRLSKSFYDLKDHKLPTVSNHLNISLNHHDALSDALACGKIALELLNYYNCRSIEELSEDFQLGQIYPPFDYKPFSNSSRRSSKKSSIKVHSKKIYSTSDSVFIKSDKFKDLSIVISGVFIHHSRDELKKMIEQNGGKNTASISKKTSFLVAGDKMGPSKREKAETLGVSIISEDEFIELLK